MNAAARIEAILIVSPRPVSLRALSRAADLPEPETREALEELARRYSPESSGVVLRHVAGGYQLATNPACARYVESFREVARPAPLSAAAYEVLATVLYMGPITRGGISAVRGVNSDAVVRSLVDRELLREVGRDEEAPGSPALLDVTEEFLTAAGAEGREDFPPLDELVSAEELERVRERVVRSGREAG
ncbi:SMC-Scp complex subunit ScpB [Rubrobacter taiwanensis]|uniref:SMC-Scp complex subunit ScpB n=1 Tax=Rubrobacter taiwanensis TaxID=185139 RepID=A0A4R1BJ00_9ACTN|nr:SMC-Scp complex subunit ScpB [Rubrobacter taiwanensis]TCJ17251.1 SMC-Scp complex subunit ScpB [Rubrobacter taiwanensis]